MISEARFVVKSFAIGDWLGTYGSIANQDRMCEGTPCEKHIDVSPDGSANAQLLKNMFVARAKMDVPHLQR
jgi:hypothetical protein